MEAQKFLEKPRVPPGQGVTAGWPVLHAGVVPRFDPKTWNFRIFGLVARPVVLGYDDFLALPTVRIRSDIHCVTGWSKLDSVWEGVSIHEIVKLAPPLPEARFVMVHAENDFTANVPLAELLQDDVLFAYRHNDESLTPDHGWPLRLVLPRLYFWKSAKWVRGLEYLAADQPGYWEMRGYHMHGDPWREERYW